MAATPVQQQTLAEVLATSTSTIDVFTSRLRQLGWRLTDDDEFSVGADEPEGEPEE